MEHLALKGAIKDSDLHIVKDAGIVIKDGKIAKVATFKKLRDKLSSTDYEHHSIEGPAVALPGFIDAHTHICFAGSRAADYALRNQGVSYLDIAKSGGGIWNTVTKTRMATTEELLSTLLKRIELLAQRGITTVEVKSGYGLSVAEELKMLRTIKNASISSHIDIIPTCLAAHMHPKDDDGSPHEYLQKIANELFPILKKEQLANRIDAFIEEEAFSKKDIKQYFKIAKHLGFDITVHADQFSKGGSAIAVAAGAVSADHLEASGAREINMLGKSETVSTVLPGASIGLGCGFAPARRLLDAGACLAIASDWNPGSAPMGDLLTQAAILGSFEKLSNAEILAGISFRAAHALRLTDRGRLILGQNADLALFPIQDYRDILYHQGQLRPFQVWAQGLVIFST
jgi:imidazolonepropionase